MEALKYIQKTREYLDYVERHIKNVEKAWKEIQEKCKDMQIIYDDYYWSILDTEVMLHDISKLSAEEFVQYRKAFYPVDEEDKKDSGMDAAWEHHKEHNPHHWENWTKNYSSTTRREINCTHMVIDWLAMSYEFGDTPREYYENNKEKIVLPENAVKYIYEIFNRLEK